MGIEIEQDGELKVMRNVAWSVAGFGLVVVSVVVLGSIWALSQLVEK